MQVNCVWQVVLSLLMLLMIQVVWGKPGIRPVDNPEYREECGACHYAYPPGLLPKRSWEKLMINLENHFGEDAEIDKAIKSRLKIYMYTYSARIDSEFGRERTIAKSLSPSDVPERITGLKYIRHEHKDLTQQMVKYNDKVKSMSNCNACHTTIDSGRFEEDDIVIPGFGPWED